MPWPLCPLFSFSAGTGALLSSHHCIYAAHNTPQAVQGREGRSVTWPLYKSVSTSSFSNGTELHAFSSESLFSPNASMAQAQTHPFQSQSAKRWEESFPSGIPALYGGGSGVSLKHVKSLSFGRRTHTASSSDSAIPSLPEDEAVMGAAAFNPEHKASCRECEKVPRRWIICLGIKLE